MVKYELLLHKSGISWRLCVSRRMKRAVFYGLLLGTIIAFLHTTQRSHVLQQMYDLQAGVSKMIDNEIAIMPMIDESEEKWRPTLIKEGHIFSAYFDSRPEQVVQEYHPVSGDERVWAMIRVIGVLDMGLIDAPLSCVYKYDEDEEEVYYRLVEASSVKPIAYGESFEMKFSAFYVLCSLSIPENASVEDYRLPREVTIVPREVEDHPRLSRENFVPIHYSMEGLSKVDSPSSFMSVCVPVFHHDFDRAANLVEFVEFYSMMGATRFVFYNESVTPDVSRVMAYYRDQGLATVLQWQLPPYYVFERTLRVDGIFVALNDCLYRSSFYRDYVYVAGVDVDEFIVPNIHKNYEEMMLHLDPVRSGESRDTRAAFIFRNVFFYLLHDDDPSTLRPDIPKLLTHSKTLRWTEVNDAHDRSKYIVRGRDTVELGNHMTWELRRTASGFFSRYVEETVDPSVATSHHYRTCETNVETCWLRRTVTDRSAHRFTEELGDRVAESCGIIFEEEGCPKAPRSVNLVKS